MTEPVKTSIPTRTSGSSGGAGGGSPPSGGNGSGGRPPGSSGSGGSSGGGSGGMKLPPIDQLKGRPLGRVLIKMGRLTREQVHKALAVQVDQKKSKGTNTPI